MTPREFATLAPLVILTLLFGIYPAPIMDAIGASVENLIKSVQTAQALGLEAATSLALK